MNKSTLLKVISILFIIFGAINLISNITSFNAMGGALGLFSSLVAILCAALQLVAGVMGVQKSDNLPLCKTLGIALIVVAAISGVLTIIATSIVGAAAGAALGEAGIGVGIGIVTGIISLAFGLLLPILYLVGIKNSK